MPWFRKYDNRRRREYIDPEYGRSRLVKCTYCFKWYGPAQDFKEHLRIVHPHDHMYIDLANDEHFPGDVEDQEGLE